MCLSLFLFLDMHNKASTSSARYLLVSSRYCCPFLTVLPMQYTCRPFTQITLSYAQRAQYLFITPFDRWNRKQTDIHQYCQPLLCSVLIWSVTIMCIFHTALGEVNIIENYELTLAVTKVLWKCLSFSISVEIYGSRSCKYCDMTAWIRGKKLNSSISLVHIVYLESSVHSVSNFRKGILIIDAHCAWLFSQIRTIQWKWWM